MIPITMIMQFFTFNLAEFNSTQFHGFVQHKLIEGCH